MQLNELVSAKLTCKGVNQVVPMKLQTEKFVQTFIMQMRVSQAQAQAANE